MSSVLGVIPARGGSKGIPRKNITDLGGHPLLYYTIKIAKETGLLDRIILSSEDEEIIQIAKKLGVEIPFVRPKELAEDHVGDQPVLAHTLRALKELDHYQPDLVLYLKPTIPFRSVEDIKNVIQKLQSNQVDSVRTVTATTGVNHPYWMFTKDKTGLAQPLIPEKSIDAFPRRQLLPPVYRLNGVVEGLKPDIILNHSSIYGDQMGLVEVPEERAVDIDTPADLDYARYLLTK